MRERINLIMAKLRPISVKQIIKNGSVYLILMFRVRPCDKIVVFSPLCLFSSCGDSQDLRVITCSVKSLRNGHMKWERKTRSTLMRGILQRSEAIIFPLCFRSRWQELSSRCDISAALTPPPPPPNTLIRQPWLLSFQNILNPLCDLKASSETQYFPGGMSSSHPPHTTTCFKDPGSAERMWQESEMDFPAFCNSSFSTYRRSIELDDEKCCDFFFYLLKNNDKMHPIRPQLDSHHLHCAEASTCVNVTQSNTAERLSGRVICVMATPALP